MRRKTANNPKLNANYLAEITMWFILPHTLDTITVSYKGLAMKDVLIFEQPLNEDVRLYLRLEHLFRNFREALVTPSDQAHRAALHNLIDILQVANRPDLRNKLTKNLQVAIRWLQQFKNHGDTDHGTLGVLEKQLQQLALQLTKTPADFMDPLRRHPLITVIQKQSLMPGGPCDFNAPLYQLWMTRPEHERQQQLETWLNAIDLLDVIVHELLSLLRESAVFTDCSTSSGQFQQNLDPKHNIQLVRVALKPDQLHLPNIGASPHRVVISFSPLPLDIQSGEDSRNTAEDQVFQLAVCSLSLAMANEYP